MKLYINGDSHVYGAELSMPNKESMAAHLADFFKAEYINDAVEGSSVDQILWRTRDYVKLCKQTGNWPDLIIIGFTDWNREDWFVDGDYYSGNTINWRYPEHFSPQRQQYYQQYILHNADYIATQCKYYNNVIYNLHSELFQLGIPHLFFNCAMSLLCDKDLLQFDWAGFYLNPYNIDFHYRGWCQKHNFLEITPGKFHYGSDANRAWAKLLYDHIQQHNLLTKDEYGSLYNLGRQTRRHHGPGVGEWHEELFRPSHFRR